MLHLEELRAEIKGEFFLREELKKHGVKKVDAVADVIIKPAGKKELVKLMHLLHKSGYPHLVINSKGRIVIPEKHFHGVVVISEPKK
jgi:UDP-N-acetylenolpyruvoylglucosamine reductase